jgi:uncharacterized protein (TIGR03066 family)
MKSIKNRKRTAPQQPQRPVQAKSTTSSKRWMVLGLVLIASIAGTWALLEFVIWNRLPSELVGRWEVVHGSPEGNFEFFRDGRMKGQVNNKGYAQNFDAIVRVEGDKIYSTTKAPNGLDHVSVLTIHTLTRNELVVVDQEGKVMKLARLD